MHPSSFHQIRDLGIDAPRIRQRKMERSALAQRRIHPDDTPVTRHDLPAYGEPNPRTPVLVVRMEPAENLEYFVRVHGVDSNPVIPD
jgi:hypothetical protein